jgi:hypothetical protein
MTQREGIQDRDDESVDDQRTDLERTVDGLEERVLGRRMDQVREEDDDPTAPAFEQDLHDGSPSGGPAAEPS